MHHQPTESKTFFPSRWFYIYDNGRWRDVRKGKFCRLPRWRNGRNLSRNFLVKTFHCFINLVRGLHQMISCVGKFAIQFFRKRQIHWRKIVLCMLNEIRINLFAYFLLRAIIWLITQTKLIPSLALRLLFRHSTKERKKNDEKFPLFTLVINNSSSQLVGTTSHV